ncbi:MULTISPECIES: DUF456 domain-containing protein [Syntrophothermus]|uniref:DUF456 domain-containing protein n=1 Tax=Syntrophothermus lipocalidus (strain DSM 12680 / TGB-C1) TaxID=643648 RepID=D7CMC5_SYNLT|nr:MULTISPECIES: DUF456 domain-containing protein [Syntrophothermus]ADI01860.1 protein of unknown function DUF456 [Syntrophothermus lipocalidus DSM 12680]
MNVVVLIIAILLMLIGLAGTFLPVLPGIPVVFLAIAGYGWYEGFKVVTPKFLAIMAGLTVLSILVDYLAGLLGAKFFGSSPAGIWGAFVGGILGLVLGGPVGLVLGPWIGAFVGEYVKLRDVNKAWRVGVGTVVGIFTGVAAKVVIGLVMIIWFLIVVF